MRQPAGKRKRLDSPEQTEGSRLAANVTKMATKMTPEEAAEHFRRSMAKIYGARGKQITAAGQ